MAGGDVDITSLTEDQQLALQQYTSVTNQDIDAALPLLRRSEWNIQIAISRFFDGEPTDGEHDSASSLPLPTASRRQETLMNGLASRQDVTIPMFEAAPRVPVQPQSRFVRPPPLFLSLLLAPANAGLGLVARLYNFLSYAFPFLPRLLHRIAARMPSTPFRLSSMTRQSLGPEAAASRFHHEFISKYGQTPLPLLQISYASAFDKAKKELKYLIIIPLSPMHDRTANFIRQLLLSEAVVEYFTRMSNKVLLWAGSMADSEPYRVATELGITRFPSVALIVHTPAVSSNAMSVVARVEMPQTPNDLLTPIEAAISQHDEALHQVRSARNEQIAAQKLRDEQTSAYERSLAKDRERVRARRAAQEKAKRQEREAEIHAEEMERKAELQDQWRRWRASTIMPEPSVNSKDAVRIQLRLLDGERVIRRFGSSAPMEDIYAFVDCYEYIMGDPTTSRAVSSLPQKPPKYEHVYTFRLVSPIPRAVYELEEGATVRDRIGYSGNLIAERIEGEEEEHNVSDAHTYT